MPTQFYQHKSNDLWSQYQSGLIDHKKYLEMLAAIKAEEINKEVSSGKAFAGTREQISNDIWNYENKQREAREKAERLKSLAPLERYKEEIPETITRYRNDANAYRRNANIFQMIIIIGSVLATSVTSALG